MDEAMTASHVKEYDAALDARCERNVIGNGCVIMQVRHAHAFFHPDFGLYA